MRFRIYPGGAARCYAAIAALAIAVVPSAYGAESTGATITVPATGESDHPTGGMPHHVHSMGAMHAHMVASGGPELPGQDAFGAIQEIVQLLEADPATDWSKVNLEELRQHLIDMNEVTLSSDAAAKLVDGGLEMTVTGTGRTVPAIQRMVSGQAQQIATTHLNGWRAAVSPLPNGVIITVTAADAKEVQHIRGLGFIGIMASGNHHQMHHLAMAKGEFKHAP
jgi:hypothetical protein